MRVLVTAIAEKVLNRGAGMKFLFWRLWLSSLCVSMSILSGAAAAENGLPAPVTVREPNGSSAAKPESAWLGAVEETIRRAEYEPSWQANSPALPTSAGTEGAWQAPNRAHDFRTYFDKRGIRVEPRAGEASAPAWTWGLALSGWGRSDSNASLPIAAGELSASSNFVSIDRQFLEEWYINDERGLEQGFTLLSPPLADAGTKNAAASIRIELAITGNLRAFPSGDGQAIDFRTAAGAPAIRYGSLRVFDSAGAVLPSSMRIRCGDVSLVEIEFDAAGAKWPVTVDPLATSPAWTAESNQLSGQFGVSVGTAGDVNGDGYSDVIVGAYLYDNGQADEGRVYVYLGGPGGLSTAAAWITESDQANAHFGRSVATAGDVNGDGYSDVIVGAEAYDNGTTKGGRAFVYLGGSGGLATAAAWFADGNQVSAQFGWVVSTAGDVNGDGYSDVLVGADFYSNGQSLEGRAFVYLGGPGGLAATPVWTAESDQANAFFGIAAGAAGDVNGDGYGDIVVGAAFYDNGQVDEGRAYVYLGGPGGPAASPVWTAESNQTNSRFASSVAGAGDVNGDGYADVIVGAPRFASGQVDEGRAFVYLGGPGGPAAAAAWTAESDQASANFGTAVATAGDVNGDGYADVIVGANLYDNGQIDEGRAYVYLGGPSGLSTTPVWTAESDQANANFGNAVGTAGDVNGDGFSDVIVGALVYDSPEVNEGRAYVYLGSPAGPSLIPDSSASGDQLAGGLGISVASAGDVNGDGYGDVIVGASLYDNGEVDEGRAYVYLGGLGGLAASPAWTVESNQAGAEFGFAVSSAGDVNGDGYSEVVVGARSFSNGEANEGRAFVFLGSAGGLSTTAVWTAESNQAGARFGSAVALAGDVNGDGYGDVLVGAPFYDGTQSDEGRAFLFLGSPSGLGSSPAWTFDGGQAGALLGSSVGSAGDFNRDGKSDVIVGAPGFSNGEAGEGEALAFAGSSSGLALSPSWTAEANQAGANFGVGVASAGDVNGDGYSDVLVGANLYSNGQANEGRAFVYLGGPSGLSGSAAWTAESDQAGASFGRSVASGDVDGDGYSDVIVGAPGFTNGEAGEGRAFVFLGSASGPAIAASWIAESNQAGAAFGSSVASAGDVNGDGYADVLVGSPGFDAPLADSGKIFVFQGNGGPGLALKARQRRADDSSPIDLLGKSDSFSSFRAAALLRTPFGRGKAKLQVEAKPMGTLFDGTGLQTSASWTDTGLLGSAVNDVVSGLSQSTRYHWRARALYHPGVVPLQRTSRWLTPAGNGRLETDFLTACQPLSAVSIAPLPAVAVCTDGTDRTENVSFVLGSGESAVIQWGYRTVSAGAITPLTGKTASSYLIAGADFPGEGTYFLVCSVAPTCGTGQTSNEVTVNVSATHPAASASADVSICAGGSTAISGSGGISCSWSPASGLSNAASCTPVASPAATSTYTLTVLGANGCLSTNLPQVVVTVNPNPVAGASNTGPYCDGNTIQLIGSASGGIGPYGYSWSGPGGFISSMQSPALTASAAAAGSYSLTVTDQGAATNCTGVASTIVVVRPNPVASASNGGPYCAGSTVLLNGSGSGGTGPLAYSWTGPNGFTAGTQNASIPGASTAAGGLYTLTVTDTGVTPVCPKTATTTVAVRPNPVAGAADGGPYCAGSTVQLSGSASGGTGPYTFSWSGPNGFSSAVQNPSIAAASTAASGAYSLTVTDTGVTPACTSLSATNVTVNPNPAVTATSGGAYCTGGTIQLSGSASGGTGPYLYSWSGPSGFTSSLASPGFSATLSAAGLHTLTVTDSGVTPSCVNSSATTVVVHAAPSASSSNTGPYCTGSTVLLSGSGSGGVGPLTYFWSGPGGFTSSAQNPQIPAASVAASGIYTLTVTDSGVFPNCQAVSNTSVTVTPDPLPTPTISGSLTGCGPIALTTQAGYAIYQWNLDGTPISAANASSYGATSSGSYSVTATSAAGCTATSPAAIVTIAGPGPVQNVQATVNAVNTLHISWDSLAGADHYVIWRDTLPGGTFTSLAGTAGGAIIGVNIDLNLEPPNVYYKIQAFLGSCGGPLN